MDRVYGVEFRSNISLPIPLDIARGNGPSGAVGGRWQRTYSSSLGSSLLWHKGVDRRGR